jgi:hypothetical protein
MNKEEEEEQATWRGGDLWLAVTTVEAGGRERGEDMRGLQERETLDGCLYCRREYGLVEEVVLYLFPMVLRLMRRWREKKKGEIRLAAEKGEEAGF